MSYATRGSGGGGGFGGFPYRGAHQQGNDNNNNNNNNNRQGRQPPKSKYQKRKERGGPLTCRIYIHVPSNSCGCLIGPRGATIKGITGRTRSVIDVPRRKRADSSTTTTDYSSSSYVKVSIQASCVPFLLHACWEVVNLITEHNNNDGNEVEMDYSLTIQGMTDAGKPLKGKLRQTLHQRNNHDTIPTDSQQNNSDGSEVKKNDDDSAFMAGIAENPNTCMSAYCISTTKLKEEDVSILVDNQRFIDPTVVAHVDTITLSIGNDKTNNGNDYHGTILIFIYGSKSTKPQILYSTLLQKVNELECDVPKQ